MKRLALTIACLVMSTPAWPQTPPAPQPAPQPAQPTVQQRFDAGSAALIAGNWEEALAIFQGLEQRLANGNPRSLAVTRVRMATALLELGRLDEAATALRLGLPNLPADDASLNEDRYEALVGLGRLSEARLDYPEALALYRQAAEIPLQPLQRLTAYRGIIQTQLFDDPAAAVREADAALALVRGAEGNRNTVAQLYTLKGRALLNLGRYGDARIQLSTAMRLLGGLALQVDYSDLVTRSDLALAALLAGDDEEARRFLAYTGSGRFEAGYITSGSGNNLPPCGGDLTPDDVAVIQLWVLQDGTVANVVPIYASRSGPSALIFARAVSGWTFDPEPLRQIPPLLLAASRVEVRCRRSEPEWGISTLLDRAAVELSGVTPDPDYPVGRRLVAPLRAAVEALNAQTPPAQQVLALMALARHPLTGAEVRRALFRRAYDVAVSADMPPRLLAPLAYMANSSAPEDAGSALAAALAEPAIQRSSEANAMLRLLLARRYYYEERDDMALGLVDELRTAPAVAGNPELAANLTALANQIVRSRSDVSPAASRQARPCLVSPRRQELNLRSTDFPNEAIRWGFEGWAVVEFSIAPDGRTRERRTLAAYPPFVFGTAAQQLVERYRYDPPGDQACVESQSARFEIQP